MFRASNSHHALKANKRKENKENKVKQKENKVKTKIQNTYSLLVFSVLYISAHTFVVILESSFSYTPHPVHLEFLWTVASEHNQNQPLLTTYTITHSDPSRHHLSPMLL